MLEKFPLFFDLPGEHLARLESISREISVKKGSVFFSPGDATQGFFALLDGAVRLYRVSPKGKEITLEIAGAGSTFAEASLFSDVYHCCAEALKDSTVHLIRKDAFLELIQRDLRFAAAWIHILSLEVIHHRQRIEELSLKSPRARIVSYILLLAEMQNSASVTLPVHRKSIATLLGMTHETFYRTAKELENEGLVRFDGQKIEIVNRHLLEELVG
ncbi:MAG: Crp/Fnr family transcriptional regulator [Deltaproteobacteria bacterium]|nr:Crp/Fnr family transcriptional regulator [Deltaproteobacteria bacterium]